MEQPDRADDPIHGVGVRARFEQSPPTLSMSCPTTHRANEEGLSTERLKEQLRFPIMVVKQGNEKMLVNIKARGRPPVVSQEKRKGRARNAAKCLPNIDSKQ